MLHGVPWFLLGCLWAILYCEYRGFRRRLKLVAQIRALESELAVSSEEYFESAKAYRDVRNELIDLLAAAQSARANKTSQSRRLAAPAPRHL